MHTEWLSNAKFGMFPWEGVSTGAPAHGRVHKARKGAPRPHRDINVARTTKTAPRNGSTDHVAQAYVAEGWQSMYRWAPCSTTWFEGNRPSRKIQADWGVAAGRSPTHLATP